MPVRDYETGGVCGSVGEATSLLSVAPSFNHKQKGNRMQLLNGSARSTPEDSKHHHKSGNHENRSLTRPSRRQASPWLPVPLTPTQLLPPVASLRVSLLWACGKELHFFFFFQLSRFSPTRTKQLAAENQHWFRSRLHVQCLENMLSSTTDWMLKPTHILPHSPPLLSPHIIS